MEDKEIIKALECCYEGGCCCECPMPDYNGYCKEELIREALELIEKQQATLTAINDLIVENTYPGFDKKGKPVCIWNTDGYKKIENLLKALAERGADNA